MYWASRRDLPRTTSADTHMCFTRHSSHFTFINEYVRRSASNLKSSPARPVQRNVVSVHQAPHTCARTLLSDCTQPCTLHMLHMHVMLKHNAQAPDPRPSSASARAACTAYTARSTSALQEHGYQRGDERSACRSFCGARGHRRGLHAEGACSAAAEWPQWRRPAGPALYEHQK